jgi:TRAP-type transport system periplasmic protein
VKNVVIVLVSVVLAGGAVVAHAQLSGPTHIRWVVAHQPVSLFDDAQETFARVFNEHSDGMRIEIEGLDPQGVGKPPQTPLTTDEVFGLLDSGDVQMATVVVASLHDEVPVVGVLALPYLIKNYDGAARVLEGAPGALVLNAVSASTSAEALAFTYSGGLQIIETVNKKIRSPADMRGMRIGTPNAEVSQDTLRAMGATPVKIDSKFNNRAIQDMLHSGELDGVEYTYTRLSFATTPKDALTVNETYHSLFLTTILVSDEFFASLSETNKEAFRKAAIEAARVERADSLQLADDTKAALAARGDFVAAPTTKGDASFKASVQAVYAKYAPVFGQDLIGSIRELQP